MHKSCVGLLAALCIVSGSSSAETNSESVYVPPPVGSHLGGGYASVPKKEITGNDEAALLHAIRKLDAAANTKAERSHVVTAVSRSTGVSERELQAQQDILQLRFGELCAVNAIARGDSNKVQEIATLKAKGRTWTQIANANGLSIATVWLARNSSWFPGI